MTKDRVFAEELRSVFVGGALHAAYPTALRTLCLLECQPRGENMLSIPTCSACLELAGHAAFRQTAPRSWLSPRKRVAR